MAWCSATHARTLPHSHRHHETHAAALRYLAFLEALTFKVKYGGQQDPRAYDLLSRK